MVCVPTVSEEVVNFAIPLAVVPVPIIVVPLKNVTTSPSGTVP